MKFFQRLRQAFQIGSWRFREYLEFDSFLCKRLIAFAALSCAGLLFISRRGTKAFSLLARLHRSAFSPWASRRVETLVSGRDGQGPPRWLAPIYQEHIDRAVLSPAVANFLKEPRKLFESMAIVLKSSSANERGVLLLGYSYIFPFVLKLFDMERVAARYFLVLEPSWSGCCDPDILCYSQLPFPTFVQAIEPRDSQFLLDSTTNLIPVPLAANWWVDHRVFRPLPDVAKDADIVMVAGWGRYKRHFRFFSALTQLRKQGHRLKTILVGYPLGATQDDLRSQARYYGILDSLEFHEGLSPEQVNHQLNRAKVNLIWSRREGSNRAVVEGMLAGLPSIQREGFNYGHHHAHVNPHTGAYCSEQDLPRVLLDMLANYRQFTPREWIMENMSCQKGAELLGDCIGHTARKLGERWSGGLVAKASALNGMFYWNPEDRRRFEQDYAYLANTIRK
jgi:glycosyltransferase involved in cell wall biosynthesis